MSIVSFYRLAIWMPVIVPVASGVIANGLRAMGMPTGSIGAVLQFLASTIVYGLPYIPFALLATWLIRRQDEYYIRRLIFVMPILMTLVAIVLCVVVAAVSGRMRLWIEVAEFAATVILLVGYSYVALTFILRPFAVRSSG